jgi:acyl carrier protein
MSEIDTVLEILRSTLQLGKQASTFTESTPLLGSIPELDSMAVVALLTTFEEHYGIVVEDDDVSAETFETLGTLTRFIEAKIDE